MWAANCVVEELQAAEKLLDVRGHQGPLATQLLNGLVSKIQGVQNPSAADLVMLFEAINASKMPAHVKEKLGDSLDAASAQGLTAVKATVQPQQLCNITAYLTQSDWDALESQSMWAGTVTVATRLRKVGVHTLKEHTKKVITAMLVALEMERTNQMPPYMSIYQLSKQVLLSFHSLKAEVPSGITALSVYPPKPQALGAKALQIAYGTDMPITRDMPTLANLVANHTPVRSTSQLLVQERQQSMDMNKSLTTSSGQNNGALVQCQQDQLAMTQVSSQLLTGLLNWVTRTNNVFQHLGQGQPDQCHVQFLNNNGAMQKPPGDANVAHAASAATAALPLMGGVSRQGSGSTEVPGVQGTESHDDAKSTMLPNDVTEGVASGKAETTDLEQVEEEAFQSLKNKAVSVPKAGSGVFKRPAAGKKVAPKNKACAKKKTEAKAVKAPGGCIRCRGNPNGCSSCNKTGFAGKTFKNHQEWKRWAALNGKK